MAMKRQKVKINGWLNLWKPVGPSSMQAVAAAKRLFNADKAGHAGTLDPLADGILPIAFGEATKLIPLLHNAAKSYRFTVRWGVSTNTDDGEGVATATSPNRPTAAQINAILPRFTGLIDQVPPAISAIKINGVRSYAAARAGETLVLAARPVTVHGLTLLSTPDADTAVFNVVCGTGTYVRALARDMAAALGTVAHCLTITRVFVGHFHEDDAILLEKLEQMPYESRGPLIWPLLRGLDDIPAVQVTDPEAQRLRRGLDIGFISKTDYARLPVLNHPDDALLAIAGDSPVAICAADGPTLKPKRVINT